MKMKRKFLAMLMVIAMICAVLTGCGGNTAESDPQASTDAGSTDSYKVAIVQLTDNGAFTEMITAFQNKMRELGYDEDKMTFEIKNAQGSTATLNSICSQLKNEDYDLIVPIVTPATQAVVNAEVSAPVVFISVTSPVGAGVMTSLEKPDKNATGTSNIVPVDEIFKLGKQLTPDMQDIGILYCTGEENAVQTVAKAKDYLEQNGYSYTEKTVTNSSEVQQAAMALAGSVDAIYVPIDSTLQTAMTQVVEVANQNNIPVYGSDPVMVQSGALASVSCSNTQLGEKSAQMADQILKGTPVSEIPAVELTDYQYVVNSATAETLGIELPDMENLVIIGD